MNVYEVPLSPEPQSFQIEMAGTTYQMRLTWNPVSACWVLDISDTSNVGIVLGIPVVTGTDLLGQYAYLNFGGSLLAQTDHSPQDVPTFTNLGLTGRVFFITGA